MKSNICNVSVLSEPDLELLSNMDPNHVADVTGKDFIEQLKEASGRLGGGDQYRCGISPHLSGCLSVFLPIITLLSQIYFTSSCPAEICFECTNDI